MSRKIIHLDLDAFFCAVEEQRDPGLIGKPFAVGGKPQERGVVSSCSYAARAFGVRSAMPMARATRICPNLIVVSPHHKEYSQASQKVMAILRSVTALVEQISIDEAFLDVSDLPEAGETIAHKLQEAITKDLGLPCSLGVASNKLVAKIATDVGKSTQGSSGPPNAITVVSPGSEAAFLASLPVNSLWGIGPKTAERLHQFGIKTIGALASTPEQKIKPIFGKVTQEILDRASGIDERPIVTHHDAKSISQETTFPRDISDEGQLKETLKELAASMGRKLRKSNLHAETIKLKLRWSDFTTITRQMTLSQPTDQDRIIYKVGLSLFEKSWRYNQPVRLLGLGVSGLSSQIVQLSLWEFNSKEQSLQQVLDELNNKYGVKIVHRGSASTKKDYS